MGLSQVIIAWCRGRKPQSGGCTNETQMGHLCSGVQQTMESPTLPRVYVLPRAGALLPAKRAVNTPQPFPPSRLLCSSTSFIWGVLQLLSFSVLRRSSGLEVCGRGEHSSRCSLKAPALGGLGQACEEGVRGQGAVSFSVSSGSLVLRLPAFSSGARACLKSGPGGDRWKVLSATC